MDTAVPMTPGNAAEATADRRQNNILAVAVKSNHADLLSGRIMDRTPRVPRCKVKFTDGQAAVSYRIAFNQKHLFDLIHSHRAATTKARKYIRNWSPLLKQGNYVAYDQSLIDFLARDYEDWFNADPNDAPAAATSSGPVPAPCAASVSANREDSDRDAFPPVVRIGEVVSNSSTNGGEQPSRASAVPSKVRFTYKSPNGLRLVKADDLFKDEIELLHHLNGVKSCIELAGNDAREILKLFEEQQQTRLTLKLKPMDDSTDEDVSEESMATASKRKSKSMHRGGKRIKVEESLGEDTDEQFFDAEPALVHPEGSSFARIMGDPGRSPAPEATLTRVENAGPAGYITKNQVGVPPSTNFSAASFEHKAGTLTADGKGVVASEDMDKASLDPETASFTGKETTKTPPPSFITRILNRIVGTSVDRSPAKISKRTENTNESGEATSEDGPGQKESAPTVAN